MAIVDDDPAFRDSLRFLLELAGFTVTSYASGTLFLAAGPLSAASLIVDHHMPLMTGLELVARMRGNGDTTPVLLITALPTAAIRARAAQLGVERVLAKPVSEADFMTFVGAHH